MWEAAATLNLKKLERQTDTQKPGAGGLERLRHDDGICEL